MALTITDIIFSGQRFSVAIQALDGFKQVVESSNPLVNISILQNNASVFSRSAHGNVGQIAFDVTLYLSFIKFLELRLIVYTPGQIGSEYVLEVHVDSISTYKNIRISPCTNGEVPSDADPNLCIACRPGNFILA